MYTPNKQKQTNIPTTVTLPPQAAAGAVPRYSTFTRIQDSKETAQEQFHQVTLRPTPIAGTAVEAPPLPDKAL